MARKLYFNQGVGGTPGVSSVAVQGGSSGMAILLIFVPVITFIFYSKRGGRASASNELTDEEKKAKKAADKKAKEDEAKEKEKAQANVKKSTIRHSDPRGREWVDTEYQALQAANPNNPFYQPQPMPEGWTGENQVVNPIYKTTEEERANKKGVAKPYDGKGRTLPYTSRTDDRVRFAEGADGQPYVYRHD